MENRGKSLGSPSSQPWVFRIFIVDDHRFFTFALTSLINSQADLSVCGTAAEEGAATEAIARLSPDLVVMDLNLTTQGGLTIATSIRRFQKHVPILFVSSLQTPAFEADSKLLEPCSFVEKTADPADIISSIRQTLTKFRFLPSPNPTNKSIPPT